MVNQAKYLTIPYSFGGRDFNGCDCYGLLILYFREELGIKLFDFKHDMKHWSEVSGSTIMAENAHEEWVPIPLAEAKVNDIILIRNESETPNHCGVIVAPGRFMHTLEAHGCATSKISTWSSRIHSAYRHRSLA